MPPKQKLSTSRSNSTQFNPTTLAIFDDDDDDFQDPTLFKSLTQNPSSKPLKPSNAVRSSKKPRRSVPTGKENTRLLNSETTSKVSKSCISALNVSATSKPENQESRSSRVEKADTLYSRIDGDGEGDVVCSQFAADVICSQFNEEIGCKSGVDQLSNSFESTSSGVEDTCYIKNDFEAGVSAENHEKEGFDLDKDCISNCAKSCLAESDRDCSSKADPKMGFKLETGYLSNSIEARLLASNMNGSSSVHDSQSDEDDFMDFDQGEDLDVLIKLCSEAGDEEDPSGGRNDLLDGLIQCPLCGFDISELTEEQQQLHTNECLDRDEVQKVVPSSDNTIPGSPRRAIDVSPVLQWLQVLGLSKYEEAFVKEEVDWDTLQWLTEEDLISMGVTPLGPRKKIVHALKELRKGNNSTAHGSRDASRVTVDENRKLAGNKLITEFFPGDSIINRNRNHPKSVVEHKLEKRNTCCGRKAVTKVRNGDCPHPAADQGLESRKTGSGCKRTTAGNRFRNGIAKDIPSWCSIPGTPFRVDAFRYLGRDCSHWFLTHFHMDHYQGLTRSFSHGKIYCSSVTAELVNLKIGIPWDKIQVLPINQKINIAGIDVTCLDANHCPGSVIIFFEPPNGKVVLHTGDFRFSDEMANSLALQSCAVHTLILDTTYCNPQYDFPKQDAVIQFVIEAIQAEAFNPNTLFLIGSYTIGKERLFLEVARCLRKKLYVGTAKLRLLKCLGLPEEDMKWFTANEAESFIHVVPMWTIASFKRMKYISNQYMGRFSLIITFSPTGWTFGKGRKKPQGRRCQQGTIIRYEVPYSEHCSFTELKDFVQLVSPENIIPSVNNDGPESADSMISLLLS